MDDTVGYSYMEHQIRQYTVGGLEVAVYFTSTLENSITLTGTKSSTSHPLKIPSFISIIVNTSLYDPI